MSQPRIERYNLGNRVSRRQEKGPSNDEPLTDWHMARLERFELPTARFVAEYSIQLSYGRTLMAEREGFEPSVPVTVRLLSRELV